MKKVVVVLLLFLLLPGCSLAKTEKKSKQPNETDSKELVGVFVDINNQFLDFKTSEYLYMYFIEEQNPHPVIQTYGKPGFEDATNHIAFHGEARSFTFSGTIYYTMKSVRISIYPLYFENNEVFQAEDLVGLGIRDTYVYSFEEKQNENSTSFSIKFVPIDKLQEISIREYNQEGILLKETLCTSQEDEVLFLQKGTEYYILTETYIDSKEVSYQVHTLREVTQYEKEYRFIKRFPSDYGFVLGNELTINQSN